MIPDQAPPLPRCDRPSAISSHKDRPSTGVLPNRVVRHDGVEADLSGDPCSDLAQRSGLAKSRIKQALSKGAAWIKRRRGRRRRVRRAATRLQCGIGIDLFDDAAIRGARQGENVA